MPDIAPAVVLFNSSDDLIELLKITLETQGFVVVTGHISALRKGELNLPTLVEQHKPAAVIYDLIPPYDRQWQYLDHLRATSALKNIPFVLTSTNAKAAREIAGRDELVVEVLGRPFDLDELLAAVRRAVRRSNDG